LIEIYKKVFSNDDEFDEMENGAVKEKVGN
jgi:hypothetical protein